MTEIAQNLSSLLYILIGKRGDVFYQIGVALVNEDVISVKNAPFSCSMLCLGDGGHSISAPRTLLIESMVLSILGHLCLNILLAVV